MELRRHDCFDFEEVFDQDEVCALDGESVAKVADGLAACPQPTSEACQCKVHQSLRSSCGSLPRHIWKRYAGELPGVLMQMADADQERLVLSGICVEVSGGLPKLAAKHGKWRAYDAHDKFKRVARTSRRTTNL